jgi:hypothetical protein
VAIPARHLLVEKHMPRAEWDRGAWENTLAQCTDPRLVRQHYALIGTIRMQMRPARSWARAQKQKNELQAN